MRTTSEILKEFRKSREMTAAMMAEKLGISNLNKFEKTTVNTIIISRGFKILQI